MRIQDSGKNEIYTLKHWNLVKTPDGLSLEGHLHRRNGFPDGVKISTSTITEWFDHHDSLMFQTENSNYYCTLSDCIADRSILFLHDGQKLLDRLNAIEKERQKYYHTLLEHHSWKEAAILSWCGADFPYLKWIAYVSPDEIRIDKIDESSRFRLMISADTGELSNARLHMEDHAPGFLRDSGCPLYIENTGSKAIYYDTDETKAPVCILPGELVRINTARKQGYRKHVR